MNKRADVYTYRRALNAADFDGASLSFCSLEVAVRPLRAVEEHSTPGQAMINNYEVIAWAHFSEGGDLKRQKLISVLGEDRTWATEAAECALEDMGYDTEAAKWDRPSA